MIVISIPKAVLSLTRPNLGGLGLIKVLDKVGVLSTFLYLVYIDDLINEIQMHTNNCGILSIPSSCPTLADDMSLIALQPRALQMILDIAYSYANRWRFKFNALKSCVLKFRAIVERIDDNLSWNLGGIDIPCEDSYTHLGIVINRKCSLSDRVVAACTKGRKSYFSLADIGSPFLNPMTMSHLYKRVVLPYFKGSCVTQGGGGGGQNCIRKNWNLYIFLQRNALIDIKNLDYWYLLYKYGIDTQSFDIFFTS